MAKYTRDQIPQQKRFWKAGIEGTDLTYSWHSGILPINELLARHLRVLRGRSRREVMNNEYAAKYVNLMTQNVIGTNGITLQVQSMREDGTLDTPDNDAVEREWLRWGKSAKSVDIAERLSLAELQRVIIRSWATDGEALLRILPGKNEYGICLQVIDPELLDVRLTRDLGNGRMIYMGIEIDSVGKVYAYHFINSDRYDVNYNSHYNHTRIPANEIVHFYTMDYPGQLRGIPPLATSLYTLQVLGEYELAALTAARVGAAKMGFLQEDIQTAGAFLGDKVSDEDEEIIDAMDPGKITRLPPGVKFTGFDSKYPDGNYAHFVTSLLRKVATGNSVSYPSLTADFSQINYSSARIARLEDQQVYKILQERVIDNVMSKIYAEWLPIALLKQYIKGPSGKPLPFFKLEKYSNVHWHGIRWPAPDPQKELAAHEKEIDLKLRSRSSIIKEYGYDPETVFREIAEEEKMMKELGLSTDIKIKPAVGEPVEQKISDNLDS